MDRTNSPRPTTPVNNSEKPVQHEEDSMDLFPAQPIHIVSPNRHLSITFVAILVIVGIILHVVFWGQSLNATEQSILKQLQRDCPNGNIIVCIKNKLLSDAPIEQTATMWVGQIKEGCGTPETFGAAIRTLKSVHDDMTQDPHLTFAGLQGNINNLKNNVSDLEHWKEEVMKQMDGLEDKVWKLDSDAQSMQTQIDTLDGRGKTLKTGFEEQSKQPFYINGTIKLFKTDVNKKLAELQELIDRPLPPDVPDVPDVAKLQEILISLALNLTSVFKIVVDIQGKELPGIRADIAKTNTNITDLNDTAILNHTKTEEALQEHSSQIRNQEGEIQILSNSVRTQETALENLKVKVGDHKDDADKNVKTINEDIDKLRTDLGFQDRTLQDLSTTVEDYKTDTDKSLSNHNNRLCDIEESVVSGLKFEIKNVDKKASENEKAITNHEIKYNNRLLSIEGTVIPDLKVEIKTVDKKASENEEAITSHEKLASERQSAFEDYRTDLESKQGQTFYKQSVSQELIDEMRSKMILHDVSFYLGLFSIGCCVLLFMNSMKNKQIGWSTDMKTTTGKQTKHRDNIDVYQLKWKGPVENSVCVVTFHSETERQHTAETKSVFESGGATLPVIHTRLIRRHTDIQDLPGSRIFIVFIDFNERNVILEDPNKGLGDLRVTTVRSLWKFGGDVTVIYCRDQGSRQLGGELFNRDLSSIYSQPELSQLKNQQRILSIFEGFSDHQKEHCRDVINRQLKRA